MPITGQSTYFAEEIYFKSPNPFRNGYIGQCTWYCWSKAHVKAAAYPERKLKVDKLPTSGASKWAADAEKNGYTVSETPKSDSIACWTGGHVAYVEKWEENLDNVVFSEANWYSGTNPSSEIVVPSNVYDIIKANVAKITDKVTVKDKTSNGEPGTDGQFKNLSLDKFKKRKSGKCYFIYLN